MMKTMIKCIYDNMWQSFKMASESNDYELDPYLLNVNADTRRGISALAYLKQGDVDVLNKILAFQKAVQYIEPNQYYHSLNEWHLTILSIISCIPNFNLNMINVEPYAEIFRTVFSDIQSIKIRYHGISASTNCIIIQGFPMDDALENVRNHLRQAYHKAGLKVSFDSRYQLVTAHSSLIRFKFPINENKMLFDLCQQYRHYDFGIVELTEFELVFNNWYQHRSITQSLAHSSGKNLTHFNSG